MQIAGICKECFAKAPQGKRDELAKLRTQSIIAIIPGFIIEIIAISLLIWDLNSTLSCSGFSCLSAMQSSMTRTMLILAVNLVGMCVMNIGARAMKGKTDAVIASIASSIGGTNASTRGASIEESPSGNPNVCWNCGSAYKDELIATCPWCGKPRSPAPGGSLGSQPKNAT